MLQYLIILLDDASVSFCHYGRGSKESRMISLSDLKAGILFAMKQNLMIQFIYPDFQLPAEYEQAIETIDSHRIAPLSLNMANADVVVIDGCKACPDSSSIAGKLVVARTAKSDFFANWESILSYTEKAKRVNVVLTDAETFTEDELSQYGETLEHIRKGVKELFVKGYSPQINLLTDRILLEAMNNCNAGIENITLAPNGKFYICPAFYQEDETDDAGNLADGLNIANRHLYMLRNAPLCRNCDAYSASVASGLTARRRGK